MTLLARAAILAPQVGALHQPDPKTGMNDPSVGKPVVIEPYRVSGHWVFDHPPAGLVAQPFARGIPDMLALVLARKGMTDVHEFRLTFSHQPFPDWDGCLIRVEDDPGGPSYRLEGVEGEPSGQLFLLDTFYPEPPGQIYFRFERIRR